MINKEYLEAISNNFSREIERTLNQINACKQPDPRLIMSIGKDYAMYGMICFCDNRIEEGKIDFYKALLCDKWLMENYVDYTEIIYPGRINAYSYPVLFYGILSGNMEIARERAELFGKYKNEEEGVYPYCRLLGFSLKYVILNDIPKANEWLDLLDKEKETRGMKEMVNGHGRAMRGLINLDEKEFNKGLEKMLKTHVSRMKKQGYTLEQYFAYDSVAFAMLAKARGINVTVEHELLPTEYFIETSIEYDEITHK